MNQLSNIEALFVFYSIISYIIIFILLIIKDDGQFNIGSIIDFLLSPISLLVAIAIKLEN